MNDQITVSELVRHSGVSRPTVDRWKIGLPIKPDKRTAIEAACRDIAVAAIVAPISENEISKRSGVSRPTVAKWGAGKQITKSLQTAIDRALREIAREKEQDRMVAEKLNWMRRQDLTHGDGVPLDFDENVRTELARQIDPVVVADGAQTELERRAFVAQADLEGKRDAAFREGRRVDPSPAPAPAPATHDGTIDGINSEIERKRADAFSEGRRK